LALFQVLEDLKKGDGTTEEHFEFYWVKAGQIITYFAATIPTLRTGTFTCAIGTN